MIGWLTVSSEIGIIYSTNTDSDGINTKGSLLSCNTAVASSASVGDTLVVYINAQNKSSLRIPSTDPTNTPTMQPTVDNPTKMPSNLPSNWPTNDPSHQPSSHPTLLLTFDPSQEPTAMPIILTSMQFDNNPTMQLTVANANPEANTDESSNWELESNEWVLMVTIIVLILVLILTCLVCFAIGMFGFQRQNRKQMQNDVETALALQNIRVRSRSPNPAQPNHLNTNYNANGNGTNALATNKTNANVAIGVNNLNELGSDDSDVDHAFVLALEMANVESALSISEPAPKAGDLDVSIHGQLQASNGFTGENDIENDQFAYSSEAKMMNAAAAKQTSKESKSGRMRGRKSILETGVVLDLNGKKLELNEKFLDEWNEKDIEEWIKMEIKNAGFSDNIVIEFIAQFKELHLQGKLLKMLIDKANGDATVLLQKFQSKMAFSRSSLVWDVVIQAIMNL